MNQIELEETILQIIVNLDRQLHRTSTWNGKDDDLLLYNQTKDKPQITNATKALFDIQKQMF